MTRRQRDGSADARAVRNCERLHIDLDVRRHVFAGATSISVPRGSRSFWSWFCSIARRTERVSISEHECAHAYPAATRRVALWFSGGCESTYTLAEIRPAEPDLLRIEDFDLFEGEHRRFGQIHFLCAGIAAALGYRTTYLGVERHDLLLPHTPAGGRYLERSPEFLDAWSAYRPENALKSVCRHLAKEEILRSVVQRGLPITGTCDRHKDGRWCGDCFKCYETFYTAKAANVSLPIRLRAEAFDRYQAEYLRYLRSGFVDNFNNAQQYFARLQIMYNIRFDREADCRGPAPVAPRVQQQSRSRIDACS
jgi:hypothetical protein